jgi:tRNA(fMet)-specific endonuclease VapC
VICLDTNVVIAAIHRRPEHVRARLDQALASGAAVWLSVIVLYELHYGIAKSQKREASLAELDLFLTMGVERLPFETDDAIAAGDIRAALERVGRPIGPYDVLIAAQARRRDAVLVTANRSEFGRVPGLRVEDWSASTG